MNATRLEILENTINLYKVDIENGVVFSKTKGTALKPALMGGYHCIQLCGNSGCFNYKVHEIICYVGGLDLLEKTVNHIDGNKLNNRFSNLETITNAENVRHARRTGLINNKGEKHGRSKLTDQDVKDIRMLFSNDGRKAKELSEMFGVSDQNIRSIVSNKIWTHVG